MGRKIDVDDLIGPAEAAEILGLGSPNAVAVYRKRDFSSGPPFPAPVIDRGRCVLWLRQDVETWAKTRRSQ